MQLRLFLHRLDAVADFLQSPLLLVIRLYWGWSCVQTGWGKLTHLDRTAQFFDSLHIPAPKLNAILAGATETGCGALLALGLFARPAAVPLIGVMAVAYATDDREALLSIATDPDKFTSAAPFLFLLAALLVLVFGPGKLALDALLGKGGSAAK